jgi:hypothetical protein
MIINYFIFISFVFVIYLISPLIYKIWIGDEVVISKYIHFAVFIYLIIMSWNAVFGHFLGGINVLDLQLKIAVFHILSNIPFCWFLAVYCDFGSVGIIWATNINLLILSIGLPLQSYNFLKYRLNK